MSKPPYRSRSDISPEDELDAWLNARASEEADDTSRRENDALAGVAYEFHGWADDVQQRDSAAKGPADDLWNRVLHEQRRGAPARRSEDMDSVIGKPIGAYAPPRSNRTRRAEARPSSRSGTWFNAIAAALLIVTLGGGAYISSNGGFGFGGGGDEGGRYAAQVVSPEASPASGNPMCNVEPLTTEEIVNIVENPNSYIPYGHFGTPPPGEEESGAQDISEGLMEIPTDILPRPNASDLRVPTEDEFETAQEIADHYYACMVHGTHAQLWALLNPHEVQRRILSQFPVYRDSESIREYVASIGDEPVTRDPGMVVYADDSNDGRRTYANPDPTDARVYERGLYEVLPDADMMLYIGEEYRAEDESVIAVTSWDATPLQGDRADLNGGQSLILIHSESTDRWFVQGSMSPRG